MAKVICIMGESGSGKTTSLRNLKPMETFYIDADGKGLSWKGWGQDYSVKRGNYVRTDDPDEILRMMMVVNGGANIKPPDTDPKPKSMTKHGQIDVDDEPEDYDSVFSDDDSDDGELPF